MRMPEATATSAAPPESGSRVEILPVADRSTLERFVRLPWDVYRDDPAWVPPLLLREKRRVEGRHPFFSHGEAAFWLAVRAGRAVGRVSAQIDRLHLQVHGDATGHFGLLEATDDPEVFRALLRAAEAWLRARGMRRVTGPFHLSINEEVGTLVEGFEAPPVFLMPHGRPYYDVRVREQGYRKAKDLLAYILDTRTPVPDLMRATVERAGWGKVRLRPVRLRKLDEDLEILRDIFNDAWSNNWGFVPFTPEEFRELGTSLRLFVPPEFVQIAYVGERPAAMLVLVPDLNEVLREFDGRLFPFRWLRLWWRIRRGGTRTARVPLMGVRRRYQRSALGMALVFLMIEAVREPLLSRGFQRVELSWILEDNLAMRHVLERIGARPYKRYRVYEKELD
ncbi:MAG: DNA-binding protein [Candidatus Binatia bacterium]|nr:MAG: DNA-binding protein [Candidatus Binatia bacterium]